MKNEWGVGVSRTTSYDASCGEREAVIIVGWGNRKAVIEIWNIYIAVLDKNPTQDTSHTFLLFSAW